LTKAGYKMTEIGEVPEEWEAKPLSKVATYINGMAFKPSEWRNSGIPIVRIENLNNINASFNYYQGKFDSRYLLYNGEILLSWSASLGVYIWNRGKALLNQHIFKVIPVENVSKQFLFWVLHKAVENLSQTTHGSTMKHFKKGQLEKTLIWLPPLPEQQKIAEILSTADDEIQKVNEKIALTEQLKKGLMQKLLTRGIGHTRFKMTEIGEIPKEWEIKKIKDISMYVTDGTHKTPHYIEEAQSGVPFISTENIKPYSNEFDFSRYKRYIDEISYKELSKRAKPEKGDLLISKCGTIGRTQLIRNDIKIGIFVGLLLVKIKNNTVSGQYFEDLLNSDKYRIIMASKSPGSTRKTLAIGMFKDIVIPLPPLPEQQKIAEILSTVDNKLELLRSKREKLNIMTNGLMNDLLTGKVRVKV